VAPEPFGDGVRDLEECSGRVSEEGAACTYCCSGRTWTLLALLSFRSDLDAAGSFCSGRRKKGERKRDGRGFGARERRVKGNGMAGVPSQGEGTGQEEREKAGKPGFPRNGRERARKTEKAGRPGFPRNGRERARKTEKAGKPGFPRNGRERARKTEKAGKPGFPRSGRERARKNGESGLSARSEAESESVLELG
jgi:hypothetical protein